MEQPISDAKYELILRRVNDLPSLPHVIETIVELLNKPNASAAELAQMISYDPGLTSKFLRMVNSAAYGFNRQISSVQHAIMILGFSMVRGVVLSASIFKLLDGKHKYGIEPEDFWRHSIATAIASRVIASRFKIPYADDAFSAGMLHDIGKMILDYYFTSDYRQVIDAIRSFDALPHGDRFLALEREILHTDHTELGHQVAVRWKLPSTLIEAIRYHHAPQEAPHICDLAYVVALANIYSKLIQYNDETFDITWIPEDIQTFFNPDNKNPVFFKAVFDLTLSEMDGVEELLQMMQTE